MKLLGTRLLLLAGPVALSIVGLVLSALALFAGHEKGVMEDYAIVRLNVSSMGYDLISTGNDASQDGDEGGFLDGVKDTLGDVKDSAIDKINDLVGDSVGEVATALGISEWYSIHVMSLCEGDFEPNGTASSLSLNISKCTNSPPTDRVNLSRLLDKELSLGPVDVNLKDLGWPDEIQDALDKLNAALTALFIFYVLALAFSAFSFLGGLWATAKPEARRVNGINLLLATLAMVCLAVSSIAVTVGVTKGVDEISDAGRDAGVNVSRGNKFLAVTWAAMGVMLLASVFWLVRFCVQRRKFRARPGKKTHEMSEY